MNLFFKYCIKCDEKFKPTGRNEKVCPDCKIKNFEKRRKKESEGLGFICPTSQITSSLDENIS